MTWRIQKIYDALGTRTGSGDEFWSLAQDMGRTKRMMQDQQNSIKNLKDITVKFMER